MNAFLQACLSRNRTVLSLLAFILLSGLAAYITIPIESTPDVKIPTLYVWVTQRGISPADAETQLLKPLERRLKNIEGVKEMRSSAYEGSACVTLEFAAGFNPDKARQDVREKVQEAESDFPIDADKPTVNEINLSLMPVLVVKLSGQLPQRALYKMARDLKDQIEAQVPSVLKAELVGNREEMIEILINPMRLHQYNLTTSELIGAVNRNHMMVPAGNVTGLGGEFALKVPGLVQDIKEILEMPLVTYKDSVVKLKDVASVRRTFKDARSLARDNGVTAVSLEISKRTGENIIQTIDAVRKVVDEAKKSWPQHLNIDFSNDSSKEVKDMLLDLQNNIISAIFLVMAVVVFSLGWRSAFLVGVAVPGSFLAGILVLKLMGLTMNIVVLFSLILSVGMLVDGAIIVVEYADRRMAEGASSALAYLEGAQRMAWPVITSIVTILVVFLPLLFWPGVVGQFMRYLPITLLATLSASLIMALIFIPALGQIFGKPKAEHGSEEALMVAAAEEGDLTQLTGFNGWYVRILDKCLDMPGRVLMIAFAVLLVVKMVHGWFGNGVEFFPDVEPETSSVLIHARGNLSIEQQNELVRNAEKVIMDHSGYFKSIYTKVGKTSGDLIGQILVEFADWQKRPTVDKIMAELAPKLDTIPGVQVEFDKHKSGPSGGGKSIQVQLSSNIGSDLNAAVASLRKYFDTKNGLTQVEDTRPIPEIEWAAKIDRAQAAKFGATVQSIGEALQFVTNGLYIGSYRPEDSPDEVEIYSRFPAEYRSFDEVKRARVLSRVEGASSAVPLENFVNFIPVAKVAEIKRTNGKRAFVVQANVAPGEIVDRHVQDVRKWLAENPMPSSVDVQFKGEDKEQQETGIFLITAFALAIICIAIILVTQFNSFFSTALVLSSVVMSTVGVMLGLLITGKPFGIVMGGIGVIALAGIIVSNNIILIDTFDQLRNKFPSVREAILRTGAQRLRPVILTKLTAILGLLPIMFAVTIDFINIDITQGAPSTQWWTQLSSTIVFGILFASVLTLVVTPCALMFRENRRIAKAQSKIS